MIGKNLAKVRKKLGMSQQVFATTIGKSMMMLRNYENDVNYPPSNLIELLIKNYNVEPNWLFNIAPGQEFDNYEVEINE